MKSKTAHDFNDGVETAVQFFLGHVAMKDLSKGGISIYPAGQAPTAKRLCMANAMRSLKKEAT